MIDLASHIEYLLLGHDCVVVPGLGAFLVHETPAHYDAEAGMFMPPVRTLGFNQAITINDGLLVESVARKRGISLDAARVEVDSAVSSFRHQLLTAHSLPVGNLGVVSEAGEALVYEPSVTSAVSLRYAGLQPLNVMPLAEEKPEAPETIELPAPRRDSSVSVLLKIAASVIIAIVACGVYFTTDRLMGNRHSDFASLDSGLRARVECPAPDTDAILDVSREIELNIASPRERQAPEPVAVTAAPEPGRYLLVVGSFPTMKSALRHINGDKRMSILEMDGNYRIYAASARTNAEAHAKADSLRAEFPTVWICRR